jgi:hypothetical protein
MRILQAPVARKTPRRPAAEPPVDPDVLPASASLEDGGLRAALLRLGTNTRAKLTSR